MSAEAVGYVYRCSPATDKTFGVHLAVADSVNDQYEYEFWMVLANLAKKARTSRATVQRAIAWLVDNGLLENVDDADLQRTGKPIRYRFLFPDNPVIYDSRTSRTTRKVTGGVPRAPRATPSRTMSEGGSVVPLLSNNPSEPKPASATPPPLSKATDDPLKRAAHRLAVLAFEQPLKPVTRGGFPAVMSVLEAMLKNGHSVNALQGVIESSEPITWTGNGLSTAIGKMNGRRNGMRTGTLDGLALLEFDDEGNLVK